ncbi:hypothetical protein GRI39_02070 [Altererythrobacter indicus]|uniref:Uncharacterized protein n=1 Tax=Altericroceibacterium indicum TaxID=374177 RepID=A0A845A6E2_9SPHN|nr:hypothetical protein [Altericroceibacterium indicum]MXP24833.1 hypothetical protein [Altericroceibacterium indicum]
MSYLSLDLSKRRSGWAIYRKGDERLRSGTWVLGSEYTTDGQTYLKLHQHLMDMHQLCPIEHVYLEKPIHPVNLTGHTNIDTLRILSGIAAHVHSFGAAMGFRSVTEINVSSWRRDFIGPQKRGTKKVTLKALTMERCRQLGFNPRYDDEADAIGILDFALDFHEHITPPWRANEVLRPALGGA